MARAAEMTRRRPPGVRAALLVRRRREGVAGSGLLRGRGGEEGGESSMSTSASRAEGKETLAALPPLTIVAVLACRRRGHRIEPEGRGDVSSAPAVVSLEVGSGGTSCAREDLGLAARRESQLSTSCGHTRNSQQLAQIADRRCRAHRAQSTADGSATRWRGGSAWNSEGAATRVRSRHRTPLAWHLRTALAHARQFAQRIDATAPAACRALAETTRQRLRDVQLRLLVRRVRRPWGIAWRSAKASCLVELCSGREKTRTRRARQLVEQKLSADGTVRREGRGGATRGTVAALREGGCRTCEGIGVEWQT
jgi:hypothetical protein